MMNIKDNLTLLFREEYTYDKADRDPHCILEIVLRKVESTIFNRTFTYYEVYRMKMDGYARSFTYDTLEEAKAQVEYLKLLVSRRNGILKEKYNK